MIGDSDGTAEPITTDEFIAFIEEDTRRLASESNYQSDKNGNFCETGGADDTRDSQCRSACVAGDGRDSVEQAEVSDSGADCDILGPDACGHAAGCDFHELGVSDGGTANDSPADFLGRTGCDVVHLDGLVAYDALWNERHEVVRALRDVPDASILSTYHACMERLLDAVGVSGKIYCERIDNFRDRLIHLLGGDQPSGIDVLREMDGESDTNGTSPNDDGTSSITDELRKWASDRHCKGISHTDALNIGLIADRIDVQFDRICQQQEAVLQSIIDEVVEERKSDRLRIEKLVEQRDHWEQQATDLMNRADAIEHERDELLDLLRDARDEYVNTQAVCDELRYQREELMRKWICERAERQELQARLNKANGENKGLRLSIDEQKESIAQRKKTIGKLTRENTKVWKTVHELQAKLDEYDRTHVELPKDANGEVFRVGCTVRMVERHPEVLLTIHSMTLRDDGEWLLFAWDDKGEYSCNLSTLEFEVYEKPHDTAESIVRDLSMGSITESESIERIGALNG